MADVKSIILKVIPASIANPFVCKHHYSGRVVNNSCLHFGAFLDGKLHGVLSYGPSLCKKVIIGLVPGTKWNEFLELNRMAFDDYLPRNSESYCIARSIKLIKRNAPHIKWIISFADACQCGDGTIYRASNFVLTGIKKTGDFYRLPNGKTMTAITIKLHGYSGELCNVCTREQYNNALAANKSASNIAAFMRSIGGARLDGYSLRYMYFIDPEYRKKLVVPIIPFSKIDEVGAGMYKGEHVSMVERKHKEDDVI